MTEPYIGEVQIFGFNFNPPDWAFCDGAALPIAQHTALFSLLGVTYGGNGTTYFNLPNLAGRATCGFGDGPGLTPHEIGEAFGSDTVLLATEQVPVHSHALNAWAAPDPAKRAASPATGRALAFLDARIPAKSFGPGAPDTQLEPSMIWPFLRTTLAHENRQPWLALNFSIALSGVYPQLD